MEGEPSGFPFRFNHPAAVRRRGRLSWRPDYRISEQPPYIAVRAAAHGGPPSYATSSQYLSHFPQRTNHPYGPDASSRNRLHLASPQGGNAQAHGSLLLSPSGNGPMGSPMRPAKRITMPPPKKVAASPLIEKCGPPREAAPTASNGAVSLTVVGADLRAARPGQYPGCQSTMDGSPGRATPTISKSDFQKFVGRVLNPPLQHMGKFSRNSVGEPAILKGLHGNSSGRPVSGPYGSVGRKNEIRKSLCKKVIEFPIISQSTL